MNPIPYYIRRFQHADLLSLAEIYSSSIRFLGAKSYSQQQVAAWSGFSADAEAFEKWVDAVTMYVAVNDDVCMGFSGLEERGRIASLFVAPEFQRQGVGSGLVEYLLGEARAKKLNVVTTEASEFSKPLFEKFGFSVVELEHTVFKGVAFERYAMRICL